MRQNKTRAGKWLRSLLIIVGTVFVSLGIVGIFIPILPTTPFLLLAAAFYARSSQRFYHWLLSNRWFGAYIDNYRQKRGMPLKIKIVTVALLWITIGVSAAFAVQSLTVRIILVLIAVGVSIHILSIKTLKQ
ncbi:MAG: YbaN family protein [Dehalococcoidales bacterium]|nr:YbaN family protein [Dehalococcoidales bacterium]